jgi:ATP-dependent 26S proteasome regulatory subunit
MNTESFCSELRDYILSGHAYLHAPTTEKTRFLAELKELAPSLPDDGRQVFVWSHATGWRDIDGNPTKSSSGTELGQPDPQKVAQEILDLPEEAVFVVKDFGFYVHHKTYSYADVVIAWLSEIRDVLASTGRTVIFLGPEFDVPPAMANDVTSVEFPLPDDAATEQAVRFVMEGHELDEAVLPSIVSACRGMTQQQTEDRTALALRRFKALNGESAGLILREKAEILRRSGLLKYVEPPGGGLDLIGGNESVKRHIQRDKACFSDEARAFGINPPRGIMLTGISGCGKTAISLSAASELGIPLIQFDVGNMMSKWVGESERNTREAIRQVEAMAPCVLQLDEVEKAFGSVGGDGDSGASLRTFGTLLKWMSERTCPVYIVMTANDVSRLPPEFTRKGRIDEIYGVYLPTDEERREIFQIHLRLKKRDPDDFDLDALAGASDAYSGADIEQVVITGLKLAFHAGEELTSKHLLSAIPEVRPLSQTDPERVAAMTEWLDRHAKPASSQRHAVERMAGNRPKRVRRVAV